MKLITLTAVILALGVTAADAKRKRHHPHRAAAVFLIPAPMIAGAATARAEVRERRRGGEAQLIPDDWRLQPAHPDWNGRRYVAPEGDAWLALYASPADPKGLSAHLKTVAFADGEEITYLQGNREALAVSGFKGDRIFYRKALLACDGATWRHVAFEYPAEAKRAFDPIVSRAARALDRFAEDGCGADVFGAPPASR